ncbi:MAG: hypothetical protein GC154_13155 [bacterium]|nr:hypothetical protein [bacterium]
MNWIFRIFILLSLSFITAADLFALSLKGVTVTPHVQSTEMRYRMETDFNLGARVQIFLRNDSDQETTYGAETKIQLRGKTPDELVAGNEWSWHDLPGAWPNNPITLPPGAMTVWSWNGRHQDWGIGTSAELSITPDGRAAESISIELTQPTVWISSVSFPGSDDIAPSEIILHINNQQSDALTLDGVRLWTPDSNESWRVFKPGEWIESLERFPHDGVIAPGDQGCARVKTGVLPLTYAAIEVRLHDEKGEAKTLWTHLRIRKEEFDISGGWVNSNIHGKNSLSFEPFLKTLKRMHINTAHIADTPGYTDDAALYANYPLKYFNKLDDFDRYDTDAMLPRIHAVEFLGEPQYGGGKPVPPMKVWQELAPYQRTRLATTVTHSEERIWRFYAGLSDFPHYDAYRVCAPSPDAWPRYERWGDERLRWGAPLETIGDMTRSLRELNRPNGIGYWSQGAHQGWDHYGGRERTSPTPDELRAQAYHALANRISSLYWFNLSLKSILKFPDLIEPITRVDREIKMLEPWYLSGAAYHYERIKHDGKPLWDLCVITSPHGALLFVLDLAYQPDPNKKVFRFGPPRRAELTFPLPAYLRTPREIVRVDADGAVPVDFERMEPGVRLAGEFGDVTVFVTSNDKGLIEKLEAARAKLIEEENATGFDPANNEDDLNQLRAILDE